MQKSDAETAVQNDFVVQDVNSTPLEPRPGGLLASQPDLRHPVAVNNKSYYLINRDGHGLTDHDKDRLRQLVPLAAKGCELFDKSMKYGFWGFLAGGLLGAAIIFHYRTELSLLKKCWRTFVCAIVGAYAGTEFVSRSELNSESDPVQQAIRREIFLGNYYNDRQKRIAEAEQKENSSRQNHTECYFHKTHHDQLKHQNAIICERMALGKLYVPSSACRQLERTQDDFKPLETHLLQADSPLHQLLNVPSKYRGDRNFVMEMMKLIREGEELARALEE